MFKYIARHFLNTLKSERGDFGGGDKEEAESGISGAGQTMYERGQATPEELSQYKGSFNTGQLLNALIKYQMGLGSAPSGYLSPEQQYQQQGQLASSLYGTALKDVQDPYATYESNLQPSLMAAQDYINRQAQSRGLIRSGIPIEAMGRAGVELAIQEADKRMAYRQQALSNASSIAGQAGLTGQQNLSNLSALYGSQQSLGQGALSRQAGQAQQAAQYQAYPYQAQLGNYYGAQAAARALPGQVIGALGTIGGAMLGGPLGAAAGGAAGGSVGSGVSNIYGNSFNMQGLGF